MIKSRKASHLEFPELFFCLAAPIGVNLATVTDALSTQLAIFGYDAVPIRLTNILPTLDASVPTTFPSLFDKYQKQMDSANTLRGRLNDNVMAAMSLFLIRDERTKRTGSADKPAKKVAYIIRQLKRPEEIHFYRSLYGAQVFQVSAYSEETARKFYLAQQMRSYHATATRTSEFEGNAVDLMRRDEHEDKPSGQQLREVFPLADVFIDATTPETAKTSMEKFLKLIFGYNFHSPSREEYGMYLAKSASLRSVDLSRQVGAAICTKEGEVRALGCNEVPSPRGGSYWEGDAGDSRDFQRGSDTNDEFRHRLLADILQGLAKIGLVDEKYVIPSREFLKLVKKKFGELSP